MVDSIKRGYDEFLLKEIKDYIFQESKTKELDQIKEELLNAGHDKTAIEEAIVEIKKHNFKDFKQSDIKNDAEKKLIDAIQHFIKEQRKLKRPIQKIKKVLLDYGHSEKIVQKAIGEFEQEQPKMVHLPKTDKLFKEHIMLTSLVALIILTTLTASILDENVFLVFIGFIPSFATAILVYYNLEKLQDKIYFIPLGNAVIFFIISLISPILNKMEYTNLTIINLILSIIITALFAQTRFEKTNKPKEKIKKQNYW